MWSSHTLYLWGHCINVQSLGLGRKITITNKHCSYTAKTKPKWDGLVYWGLSFLRHQLVTMQWWGLHFIIVSFWKVACRQHALNRGIGVGLGRILPLDPSLLRNGRTRFLAASGGAFEIGQPGRTTVTQSVSKCSLWKMQPLTWETYSNFNLVSLNSKTLIFPLCGEENFFFLTNNFYHCYSWHSYRTIHIHILDANSS